MENLRYSLFGFLWVYLGLSVFIWVYMDFAVSVGRDGAQTAELVKRFSFEKSTKVKESERK